MKRRVFACTLVLGFLFAAAGRAETLDDVLSRLSSMRLDKPVKLKVEVQVKHKGTAPLHRNRVTKRGMATIQSDPDGVKVIERKWLSDSSRFSLWRSSKQDNDESGVELIGDEEAYGLTNPASTLEDLLRDATLVEERAEAWQGKTARLLVIRPAQLAPLEKDGEDPAAPERRSPFAGEVKLWLDETGIPLALDGVTQFRLGPAVNVKQHQTITFQQKDGRLFVAEVQESFESTALAILRGRDSRVMKVVSVER